jgi:D-alanyl-D-alanine carboxypeptidase
MLNSQPTKPSGRRTEGTVVAALVAIGAAVIGVLVYQSSAASSPTATSGTTTSPIVVQPPAHVPPRDHGGKAGGAAGRADGVVPDGVTFFDDHYPAVTNLDPALLRALRQAATAAAGNGIDFYVNSGWRSHKYQEQLFRQAVAKYGSTKKAIKWVAPPGTSAHESGDAVDIGRAEATTWLSKHGASYGLCQIYSDEAWHYELRPDAVTHGCPAKYADPTHDPRIQP